MPFTRRLVRIFPAWPADKDARFSNLLAEGGFEVSAEQIGGQIANVRIHATVGGAARLLSPWQGGCSVVEQDGNTSVAVETKSGISSFATRAGRTYILKSAGSR